MTGWEEPHPFAPQQDLVLHPKYNLVTQFCLLLKQTQTLLTAEDSPEPKKTSIRFSFGKEAGPPLQATGDVALQSGSLP